MPTVWATSLRRLRDGRLYPRAIAGPVSSGRVTEQDTIAFVAGLKGVKVHTAAERDGSPESAWGDSFFTVEGQRMPFAIVVVSNYPGVRRSLRS